VDDCYQAADEVDAGRLNFLSTVSEALVHAGSARRDFPLDLVAKIAFRNVEIVLGLEIEPKLRRGAEVDSEPEGRVGGERPLAERNLV